MRQQQTTDDELYDSAKDENVSQYEREVEARWGNTEAYKQSKERVKKMTKAEMEEFKRDSEELVQKIAENMDKGVESAEMQALIPQHYKGIQLFYDCPIEMYRALGEMYVTDPRFTKYYDKYRPGLAIFMRDAIECFCDHQKSNKK